MASLAEIVKGLAREMDLLDGERLNDDACPPEKRIALADGFHSDLAFEDDGEFQKIAGADQAMIRVMNDLRELAGFGFIEEMAASDEVSRIGKPCSS